MNRDERRSRAPEIIPRIYEEAGVQYAAPRDGEAGGCWIAVNEYGVAGCLLNDYANVGQDDGPRPTRGEIIPRLLQYGGWSSCSGAACEFDPKAYAPFTLLLVSLHGAAVWRWKGSGEFEHEELSPGWSMLTSSSWNSEEVEAERRRAFQEWIPAQNSTPANDWPSFNLQRWPGREEWSPMMSRPSSATRSLARVAIGETRAELVHAPAPGMAPEIVSTLPAVREANRHKGHPASCSHSLKNSP